MSAPVLSSCRWWIERASLLGEACGQWARASFDRRGPEALRSIMGLCGLIKKHTAATIDAACQKALKAGVRRLKDIKRLIGEPGEQGNFAFAFNPSIDRARIYELAAGHFIREQRDALLVGPPGVGKSHLAQAIGIEAIQAGLLVLYRSVFDLVRELSAETSQAGESRLLAKYLKPDLLIIDDMGLKILPPKSGEILLEIIMRRYENRSTLMTSNRPIEEWGKLLSDVPAASAILDRLLHHAEVLAITGRSYRLQDSVNQRASAKPKSSLHNLQNK